MLTEISITKHEKETCVEKLADEDHIRDINHLSRLSGASNSLNDIDYEHSQDGVDENDNEFETVIEDHRFKVGLSVILAEFDVFLHFLGLKVFVAEWFFVLLLGIVTELLFTAGSFLSSAEAFEGTIKHGLFILLTGVLPELIFEAS